MNTLPITQQRPSLWVSLILPQLAVLALFVGSRGPVWAEIWQTSTSLLAFFVELVTAGAGWPMLSLSALAVSAIWHTEKLQKAVTAEFLAFFANHSASELSKVCGQLEDEIRTRGRIIYFATALVSTLAVGSVAGAWALPEDAAVFSWPAIAAVLLGVYASLTVLHLGTVSTFKTICEDAYTIWPAKSRTLLALDAARDAGRLDHPEVERITRNHFRHVEEHAKDSWKAYLDAKQPPVEGPVSG